MMLKVEKSPRVWSPVTVVRGIDPSINPRMLPIPCIRLAQALAEICSSIWQFSMMKVLLATCNGCTEMLSIRNQNIDVAIDTVRVVSSDSDSLRSLAAAWTSSLANANPINEILVAIAPQMRKSFLPYFGCRCLSLKAPNHGWRIVPQIGEILQTSAQEASLKPTERRNGCND